MECTTPRVNWDVNCGLWTIMRCQCRFISCNKCPALIGNIDSGDDAYVGAGSEWEIIVPSPEFCCEPETALKNKVCWGAWVAHLVKRLTLDFSSGHDPTVLWVWAPSRTLQRQRGACLGFSLPRSLPFPHSCCLCLSQINKLQKNAWLLRATTWMELETLSDTKTTYSMVPFTWNVQKRQIHRHRVGLVVARV